MNAQTRIEKPGSSTGIGRRSSVRTIGLIALLAASRASAQSEPPALPPSIAPAPVAPLADDERIARVRRFLEVFAEDEHRDRMLRGALGLTLSTFQLATGAYLLTVRESYERPYVGLAGWLNVGPPEYIFLRSIVQLAVRGPLEKLRDALASEQRCDERCPRIDLDRLEQAWAAAARRARRIRIASAIAYITVGLGVFGYGAYLLFSPPIDQPPQGGQYIIGTELAVGGFAYVSHGLADAVMMSSVEKALRAYRAGLAPLQPTAVRLVPSVQSVAHGFVAGLQGRF